MTARLRQVKVQGFRGFAEAKVIDLDADAVIIRGDNGTGKTSVVDALVWLFTGELHHLVARQRDLADSEVPEDVVVNRYDAGSASVALVVDANGEERVFSRQGTQAASWLSATRDGSPPTVDGAGQLLASTFGLASEADLRHAVTSWGVLRQDALRAALDDRGGELHERLAATIGLDRTTAFVNACAVAASGLRDHAAEARRHLERVELHWQRTRQLFTEAERSAGRDDSTRRILTSGLAALQATLGPAWRLHHGDEPTLATAIELGSALTRLLGACRDVSDAITLAPKPATMSVPAAQAVLREAEADANKAVRSAPALVRMAAAASTLIGDTCPVCEQQIDPVAVQAHLDEITGRAEAVANDVQRTQDAVVRARVQLARVQATAQRAETSVTAVTTAVDAFERVAHALTEVLDLSPAPSSAASIAAMEPMLEAALLELRELVAILRFSSEARVARLMETMTRAASEHADAAVAYDEVSARADRATRLHDAAAACVDQMLAEALDRLRPAFVEVFDRLAPNPSFTELGLRKAHVRHRGERLVPVVSDPERQINASPALIFSEGQLNVVALSYFLGLALTARSAALPFLVLDDPLQSLDVIAILGFSDLCRHLRNERQLIVTTHDRRFADVLERKLTPRFAEQALTVHDFTSWTRDGPRIETRQIEPEVIVPVLPDE